jgi:deazaflavin-dependent oxidoreductase (nitroreductase family)
MPVNPLWIKITSATHLFWYRATGGLIGGNVLGMPALLLTTTGRKSGQRRTTPLMYLPDGDDMVVIASNGGNRNHPAWYLNLRAEPEAEVQVGRETKRVRAEEANAEERARLWPQAVKMYSGYERYQQETKRTIPVVILRRVSSTDGGAD